MSSDADAHLAALFQRVQLNPGAAEPLHHFGNALLEAGRPEEALFRFQQALRLAPDTPPIHHSLGLAFSRLERWTDAAAAFRRAIDLKPDYSSAHNNLGTALLAMGKAAQAIESFRACLRFQPGCIEAHNNLGIALAEQNQHEEAIRCFHAALALCPDCAESHLALGASLSELGQSEESMRRFHEALRLKPDAANVHNDIGIACAALNRLDDALAHFGRALELRPDYPMARKNRSLAWLVQGDFTRGWPEYENRLLESKVPQRKFEQPCWDGSPLEGKTILVYHEQGLGDTLQFVRYLPMVKARGGRVVFECQAPLAKLLAGCAGIDQLVPVRSPLPPFDVQVPLMSLPLLCGTDLKSIPAPVAYLAADPGLEQLWGQALGHWSRCREPSGTSEESGSARRTPTDAQNALAESRSRSARGTYIDIAIAWQGNPHFKRDRQRSIPLRQFAPLARVPGVRLLSVQKGAGSEQIGGAGFAVLDFGADIDKSGAFTDTAAILKNVDLVITSDTAVAHLAGALGVPVWLALAFAADWRWLLEREDCPWYPSMRLFRQKTAGDWPDVFERMAKELAGVRSHKRPRLLAGEKANNRAGCGYDRARLLAGEQANNRAGCGYDHALMALGKALAKQGQHEDAAGCFRETVRLHPGSAEAEAVLGLCCLNLGRPNDAIAPLQRSLKLRLHPDVHCNLGVAFFRIQRFDDAIANYRQAVRLEPRQVDAHHNLGNALRLAGQLDAAVASLSEAKRLRPDMAETHHLLGLTLAQQGKHADAVDAFRQAIQLNAEHAAAHLHLGTALAALDRRPEALSALRTAARLDPCNGEIPFRIANCLRQAGKLEEAVAAYRASLRVEPGAVEARLNLGVTLAGLTKLTADLKAINEALWDIEDDIRRCESEQDFDDRFIELARAVYHQNDRRAAVKRQIHDLLGSRLIEEKSYTSYDVKTPRPIATICILTYGDYLDYFRRCLDSVLACTPAQEIELRLGFNQAPGSLAYALEKLQPRPTPTRETLPDGVEMIRLEGCGNRSVTLWNSPVNLYKEPMARLMFYSLPLETEYVVWFDDDSFVSGGWWEALRALLDKRVDYLPGQQQMIREQPWYRGVPCAVRNGRPGVRFMTGGFLAIRSACLRQANFPDTSVCWNGQALQQYGGDTLLGDIALQLGWTRAAHAAHIHVNVDLEGKQPAPRRGGTGRQFGSDIDAVVR